MQPYILNEDQEMIRDLAAKIVHAEIKPKSAEVDQNMQFPQEGLSILAESGLVALNVPEAYDGPGLDFQSQICVIEETAKACGSTAFALANTVETAECILLYASENIKKAVLPEILAGTAAVTAGSDCQPNAPELLSLLAVESDGTYTLNGKKQYVFGAENAGWLLVQAAVQDGTGWFVVSGQAEGLTMKPCPPMLGFKGCPAYEVDFQNVRIDADAKLSGDVGSTLGKTKVLNMAAIAAGIAAGALEECTDYINQRVQFGKRIAEFENTQAVMAEMIANTQAGASLVWQAAGADDAVIAGLAKIYASANAAVVTRKVVQFMGGYGYSKEYPVERKMRDAKMTEILNQANETIKTKLGRKLIIQ